MIAFCDSVLWYCSVILFRAWVRSHIYAKSAKMKKLHLGHLPYYNILHTEHLTSYTNTLQLIDYQYFNQCKILPNPPTHILHNLHATTQHKHGKAIPQHRGAEKSVAPTESSTSLCCKSTAYDKIDCEAAGVMCKMYAGVCKMFWNHLTLLKPMYINLLCIKSVRWQ